MSTKIVQFSLFLSLFIFLFPTKTLAAFSFSVVEANPSTVNSKSQEVQIKISVNSLPQGDSYFRVGVETGVSSSGYLKNNAGNWIKVGTLTSDKENNRCTNYYKINSDGEYLITFKIGEDNEIMNGVHIIRAYRFTSTCGSYVDSNEDPKLNIIVDLPQPSPSISPTTEELRTTPTSIPLITPTPTLLLTSTPTKIPTATPIPTSKPTLLPTSTADSLPTSEILGVDSEISPLPENKNDNSIEKTVNKNLSPDLIAKILIAVGFVFLVIPGFFLLRPWLSRYNKKNDQV